MAFLTPGDLSPFTSATVEQLDVMIRDVEALALDAAPCLASPGNLSDAQRATVVATLRGAVLRWAEHATRDTRQLVAGPYSIGPGPQQSADRRPLLWPTEVSALASVCAGTRRRRAFVGWLA